MGIGPQRQQYHVHKALITHHSEYFHKALNGPWKEAEDKTVVLDHVDPMIFDIFSHWLYAQKLPTQTEWDRLAKTYQPAEQHHKEDSVLNKIIVLTKALIFADRFFSPGFHRAVNNAIVDIVVTETKLIDISFLSAVKFAFDFLPEDHIIVKLFVDVYCRLSYCQEREMDSEVMECLEDFTPPRHLVKLMAGYFRVVSNSTLRRSYANFHACSYHQHANSREREACNKR